MKTFSYSILAKFIYKYANIPATILLGIHFVSLIPGIAQEWYLLIPALINAFIIYLLNRFYFRSYRIYPFRIDIDNEKMICSDFAFSDKKIEIELRQITDIQGGIFSRNVTRPINIYYGDENEIIGIHNHLKEFDKLMTIILSNIESKLYNRLLKEIEERAGGKRGIKKKDK